MAVSNDSSTFCCRMEHRITNPNFWHTSPLEHEHRAISMMSLSLRDEMYAPASIYFPGFWRLEGVESCPVGCDSWPWSERSIQITESLKTFTAVVRIDTYQTRTVNCCHGAEEQNQQRSPYRVKYHMYERVTIATVFSGRPLNISSSRPLIENDIRRHYFVNKENKQHCVIVKCKTADGEKTRTPSPSEALFGIHKQG